MARATVLIVPGLRDAVAAHWQTWLEAELRGLGRPVRLVPPMGREALACAERVAAIEHACCAIEGPVVIVAHSAGCLSVAHWASQAGAAVAGVRGALLAVPPDFETPMPPGYPDPVALDVAGWLPVPRRRLPFPALVGLSRNDPLAHHDRASVLARDWGACPHELGEVGHLNPASGHGPWPASLALIDRLDPPAPVEDLVG